MHNDAAQLRQLPPQRPLVVAIVMFCLMAGALALGMLARPPAKSASAGPRFVLDAIVPKEFGDWREVPAQSVVVVNPQTKELLDKLYSQILTRTYVNSQGYQIMLSMAYGDDQRGDLQAHKPEVCYPAQGFSLHSNDEARLATQYGPITVRRLSTSMGPRKEPVTYWFTVGDTAVKNKLEQRMVEIKLGLTGQIPDGLLVRVSSIDDSPAHAFPAHDLFANDLLAAMSIADRTRVSGLGSGLAINR
ncbi:MAG TPA: EpsI family protein [Burkholderiaceae bacterium]|jgi:EpsI family protein